MKYSNLKLSGTLPDSSPIDGDNQVPPVCLSNRHFLSPNCSFAARLHLPVILVFLAFLLSVSAHGMSSGPTRCLAYAGSPYDPSLYPGVLLDEIETEKALNACEQAVAGDSGDARELTALARVRLVEGRHEDAQVLAKKAIEQGDKFAKSILIHLAPFFADDWGLATDENLGLYRDMASNGSPYAKTAFSSFVLNKQSSVAEQKEALLFSLAAFLQGRHIAILDLLHLNELDLLTDDELGERVKALQSDASKGVTSAQIGLAEVYYRAANEPENVRTALSLMKRAAEAGSPFATLVMGDLHRTGIATSIDLEKAVLWYRQALSRNKFSAKFGLALALETLGRGTAEEINALLQDAASRGVDQARIQLGFRMLEGNGTPIDIAGGERQVSAGSRSSQNGGELHKLGQFFENKNAYDKAAKHYKEAGQLGIYYSYARLELLRLDGKLPHGTNVSWVQPILRAAEDGDMAAQRWMGLLLSHDDAELTRLVTRNDRIALQWLQKAAAQEEAYSLFHLGVLYFDQAGSDHEKIKSLNLLQRAAKTGDAFYIEAYFERLFTSNLGNELQTSLKWGLEQYRLGQEAFGKSVGEGLVRFGKDAASKALGREMLLKAAESDPNLAETVTNWMSNQENGFTWDLDVAVTFLERFPNNHNILAQLGYMLAYGPGENPRPLEAYEYTLSASKLSNGYACYLGLELLRGFNEIEFHAKDAELFINCADSDYRAEAHYAYGRLLLDRNTTSSNRIQLAIEHLYKSIELYTDNIIEKPEERNEYEEHLLWALNSIIHLETVVGRYDASESAFKDALQLSERLDQSEDLRFRIVSGFATALEQSGQLEKAEKLFASLLPSIDEWDLLIKAPDADYATLDAILNYGILADRMENYPDAENIFQMIADRFTDLSVEDYEGEIAVLSRAALARIKTKIGAYDEAGFLYEQIVPILGDHFANTPWGVRYMGDFAAYLVLIGQYEEAIGIFESIRTKLAIIGLEDHPQVLELLGYYIQALYKIEDVDKAISVSEHYLEMYSDRISQQARGAYTGHHHERNIIRSALVELIDLLTRAKFVDQPTAGRTEELAFEFAQLTHALSSAGAITRMAANNSNQDDDLRDVLRQRQSLMFRLEEVNKELISERALTSGIFKLSGDRKKLEKELKDLDTFVDENAPEYFEHTSAQPVQVEELQPLLNPTEAVLYFLSDDAGTHVWVIARDQFHYELLNIRENETEEMVRRLRNELDLSHSKSMDEVQQFDLETAHRLYQQLFEPIERVVEQYENLIVVPDGGLQSLPLGVLVTDDFISPKEHDYQDIPWFAGRYTTTVLPSLRSLFSIRKFATSSAAGEQFRGIGDPILSKVETGPIQLTAADLRTRSGVAKVAEIRNLPNLPETGEELERLAAIFGSDDDSVFLKSEATETNVKRHYLANAKVVAFATHGLLSGDLEGLNEPALVLTPPDVASELDDGLLTASEIAGLDLNSDWIILSACNTAVPNQGVNSDGLAGLARAFFFAGARTLLVTHWPVESNSAKLLTEQIFRDPDFALKNRSQALTNAQRVLIASKGYSHPAFWGAYSVVGEGAKRPTN